MSETPRTWTLSDDAWDDMAIEVTAGPQLDAGEHVVVIEKAPVDIEREHMLDVIEHSCQKCERDTKAGIAVYDLLGEYGRLPKENI